ncbi:MAG: ATP-binding cassette domain-containing protein [Pseudomonadota bacterium]
MREAAFDLTPHATPVAPLLMEARGLRFKTRDRCLMDGVDIAVGQGRRLVILGANGAGKSLLLRLLHGLSRPTGGQILWQGAPVTKAARAHQAMVFQRPVLLRRSVSSNLTFALRVHGVARRARPAALAKALADARLTQLADRPARLLSGGEQQRLAVARALLADPQLLFLDEPTSHLDPGATAAVEDMLHMASSRGVTLVMVTHDAGQARRLGQDAVFLHAGRVVETGPVERLLSAPRSPATQAWTQGQLFFDDAIL